MNRLSPLHLPPFGRRALAAVLACAAIGGPHAALVDVSNVPLSASLSQVKPNLMFILDDSGSMGSDYMPDEIGLVVSAAGNVNPRELYGYWSPQCNGLAFDPSVEYPTPFYADGTSYPNASFTKAPPVDGYKPSSQSSATVDLTGSFYYEYSNPKKGSWTYLANGNVDTTTDYYKDCTSSLGTKPEALFKKFTVSAEQQQKYANWYAYYRTRRLLMRTATGHAFNKIDKSFRVGFTVISDPKVTSGSFLNVKDFDKAQREIFYKRLYEAETAEGFTPLRGALSKVGRYFANKAPGQTVDPVQTGPETADPSQQKKYSCQRNYALLSTDGYWNQGQSGYEGEESSTYGPLDLDGQPVGQRDGGEPRPMKDSTGTAAGGDRNSLADVAQYFWATDLRTDLDNNVPPTISDPDATENDPPRPPNGRQRLNTFTVGLGVRGTLSYDRNYLDPKLDTSDYANIKAGGKEWPVPIGTVSQTPNTTNATHIDDLWHAAVNGRGQYFSATNSQTLADAIGTTLNEISKDTGSNAAASASSLTPVTGDNWVFLPSYSNSPKWHGDLRAYQFTTNSDGKGLVAPNTDNSNAIWSAKTRLEKRDLVNDPRRILVGNGSTGLVEFTYANLDPQSRAYFDNLCEQKSPDQHTLSQCPPEKYPRAKATGENLVNFLRGETKFLMGDENPDNRVFRNRGRAHLLGDIANAAPVYVAKPPFKYSDAGYSKFVTDNATRTKVVYAAANDGMLHAFQVDPDGGRELWAFVPQGVLPHLRRLADVAYDTQHLNLLDATPTVGDVQTASGEWRTILVGGMGAGGRYYYALDITDPASPKLLWEKSPTNLGLTFGNPVITKDAKSTWIVAFTSGINNVGDGKGRIYLLDAITGNPRSSGWGEIVTSAGDATTPSNLVRLNAWVPSDTDNTALRFYAGDMLGNLWRFDHDDRVAPSGVEAVLIGQARDPNGAPQPITSKPVLTELVVDNQPMTIVSVGTGRLLNNADLSSTGLQTIYSVRDSLDSIGLGPLRHPNAKLVKQQLNSGRKINIDNVQSVDLTVQNGWYVDLDQSNGERVALDGVPLGSGLIAFASTVPNSDPCGNGGSSYLYQFLLTTGDVADVEISNSLIVGVSRVMDSTGRVSAFFTKRDQSTQLKAAGSGLKNRSDKLRRTAWRELN